MAQAIRICLHADCAADTVSAQQDQHAKVSVHAAAATDGDTQKADNPVPTAPQSEHQICQNCVRIHTIHWDSKYRPPEESCASLPARNPKPKEACSKERINTRTVWRAGLPQATHTNACLRRSCGLSATPHAPRKRIRKRKTAERSFGPTNVATRGRAVVGRALQGALPPPPTLQQMFVGRALVVPDREDCWKQDSRPREAHASWKKDP